MALNCFYRNGRKLEYECIGEGAPVLFLHGLGGSVLQMRAAFDVPEGFSCIAMNQQGHGESDFDPAVFCFDSLGDDAVALLDHLDIEKACFAGISMGAAVALNAAVRYPHRVKSLLLVRSAWSEQPMSAQVITAYRDLGLALEKNDPEWFAASPGGIIVERTGSAYTRSAFKVPFHEKAQLRCPEKYLLLPPTAPVRGIEEIEKMQVPAMILACRGDFCHPYETGAHLAQHIPGALFREIPSKDEDPSGHREMSNRYLRAFFCQTGSCMKT